MMPPDEFVLCQGIGASPEMSIAVLPDLQSLAFRGTSG